jgi:outer membrane translocation and assembly module TamA
MVSLDYSIPVLDPIGAVLFYDAGNVRNSAGAPLRTLAKMEE